MLILRAGDRETLFRHGVAVMLLCGIVLQIKYIAVVEGMFFGLYLLWRLWKAGTPLLQLAASAVLFCSIALAPTLVVVIFYAAVGHLDAFIYANFVSIFHRAPQPDWIIYNNLLFFLIATPPLAICAALGLARQFHRRGNAAHTDAEFLLGWVIAAALGFCIVGNYFDHYALPLLLALAVAMAPAFDNRIQGMIVAACLVSIGFRFAGWPIERKYQAQQYIADMTEAIRP